MAAAVTLPPTLRPSDPDYGRPRYDVKQAAAYLAIYVGVVYVEANAGRLGYRRTSKRGQFRFSQADLDLWNSARHVPALDPPSRRVERDRRTLTGTGAIVDLMLPKTRRFQ